MMGMGFDYTVLPDGSIFPLRDPGDYVCAAQIIADEVGDAYEGNSLIGRNWVSSSAVQDPPPDA